MSRDRITSSPPLYADEIDTVVEEDPNAEQFGSTQKELKDALSPRRQSEVYGNFSKVSKITPKASIKAEKMLKPSETAP